MKTSSIGFGCLFSAALLLLGGCSAFTSTTDTTADIAHTVTHGLSVSSRSTTDSSNSDPDSARNARARVFVNSQMNQLKREAAAGGGENINALADLLGTDGRRDDGALDAAALRRAVRRTRTARYRAGSDPCPLRLAAAGRNPSAYVRRQKRESAPRTARCLAENTRLTQRRQDAK